MILTTRTLAGLLASVSLLALPAPQASAQVITRGPYLQIPTTTGIVVRWRTDVATDSRVRYGVAPGSLTLTADDPTVTTEHAVPLTGLPADTRYYYSVGTTSAALAGNDANHYFFTLPVPGVPKPTRVWVIGDSGFANANAQAVRDAFLAYNAGNETDLWLLLGDNAYYSGTDSEYQAALFDMHEDLLRRVPPWPTFGNHEGAASNALAETGPYFAMFSLPRSGESGGVPSGTEAYFSFDYANIHFINLDGNSADVSAGSAMMIWLEADLQATTADWVIAFWHQPPYSKGALHDSDVELREVLMRGNVLPLLEDYGVDLVLCGHSHSYERSHLLDGHYGHSTTLTADMVLDSGDGTAAGDGIYRKASTGPSPHGGAVYVVAGSSSDVRSATLNHPVMEIGLLELGSMVVDVDGDTLTARFLNSLGQVNDAFTIAKSEPDCPGVPRSGCTADGKARVALRDRAGTDRDHFVWRRTGGTLPAAAVGDPTNQADLAFCLYDQTGKLLGGALRPGRQGQAGNEWRSLRTGFSYYMASGGDDGVRRLKLDTGNTPLLSLRAVGPTLALPPLPLSLPVTAQLTNLDTGTCWESAFTAAQRNDSARFIATTH